MEEDLEIGLGNNGEDIGSMKEKRSKKDRNGGKKVKESKKSQGEDDTTDGKTGSEGDKRRASEGGKNVKKSKKSTGEDGATGGTKNLGKKKKVKKSDKDDAAGASDQNNNEKKPGSSRRKQRQHRQRTYYDEHEQESKMIEDDEEASQGTRPGASHVGGMNKNLSVLEDADDNLFSVTDHSSVASPSVTAEAVEAVSSAVHATAVNEQQLHDEWFQTVVENAPRAIPVVVPDDGKEQKGDTSNPRHAHKSSSSAPSSVGGNSRKWKLIVLAMFIVLCLIGAGIGTYFAVKDDNNNSDNESDDDNLNVQSGNENDDMESLDDVDTLNPTNSPTEPLEPSTFPTSDSFLMQWASLRTFEHFVPNLRPPTVFATCGDGGTIELVETSDSDILCTTPSLSTLRCTSGDSVYVNEELLTPGESGVNVTFTCTGSLAQSLMATVEIAEESFSVQAQGSESLTEIFARVEHQLRLTRICSNDILQAISSCPSQSDLLFGFCKDDGACADTCPDSSFCSCVLTVPVVKTFPQPVPRYDSNCLVPTLNEGESCFADGMCKDGICLLGTCRLGLLPDISSCEDGAQCQSGYCELFDTISTSLPSPKACCRRDNWGGYTSTTIIPGTLTCSRVGTGMPCSGADDCHSAACVEKICL